MTGPTRAGGALLGRPSVRFVLAGGANTVLGYLVLRALLAGFAGRPYAVALANAVAYAIGIAVSFVTNRRWTFRSAGQAGGERENNGTGKDGPESPAGSQPPGGPPPARRPPTGSGLGRAYEGGHGRRFSTARRRRRGVPWLRLRAARPPHRGVPRPRRLAPVRHGGS